MSGDLDGVSRIDFNLNYLKLYIFLKDLELINLRNELLKDLNVSTWKNKHCIQS